MFHNSTGQEAQDPASTDQMSRKACSPGYVKQPLEPHMVRKTNSCNAAVVQSVLKGRWNESSCHNKRNCVHDVCVVGLAFHSRDIFPAQNGIS